MIKKVDKAAVLNRIGIFLMHFHDLALALWVVLIISFMIMPVPPVMVDLLITLNFAATLVLLMLSLYVPSVLSLSTFPTLLLFTTLFRLSLNITTTRQILLHADAGKIIHTFGQFVVGGNYVVGAVVFLIVTIVQFVVIAKGAERVAEVSARFTLDAMPGKQMSIDGDLRAETIDLNEARRRRQNLEDESKLYGAMDGAMKFVKGDAIAGLIITVINIMGGITIGVFQKGLPMAMALKKYTLLTIGDGLVSQIPALLICITAGIIVTRVDTREATGNLAGEIFTQMIARPRALMVGGCILALQGFVPGFPKLHFFAISLLIAGSGFLMVLAAKRKSSGKPTGTDLPALAHSHLPKQTFFTVTIGVEISAAHADTISLTQLEKRFDIVGRDFYNQTGVPFPGAKAWFSDQLPESTCRLLIYDVPLYSCRLDGGMLPAPTFIEGAAAEAPVNVPDRGRLKPENPSGWDPVGIITAHLSVLLHKHAVEFLDISEVRHLVDLGREHFGILVQEAQRAINLQSIVEVFKHLVREKVSVKNVKLILESIVEHGGKEKNPLQLAEYARQKLKRQIVHQYCDEQGTLNVVMLHPDLETLLEESMRQTPVGVRFAAPDNVIQNLIDKVGAEAERAPLQQLAILTSSEIRHHLRKTIEKILPGVPVLAHNELTAEIKIKPLINITASL